jgi:3-hydroxyanthranilate 3,4-dioxygenase
VPHAPQRPPNTIGIVVERNRPAGETEHQQFYCPNCDALVWDEVFDCKDIVEHFGASMEAFWADEERATCSSCNTRITKPAPVARIETDSEVRVVREGE